MNGFSMPSRWRGRNPPPDSNCLVAHCKDCRGLFAVCPDPTAEDFALFEAMAAKGQHVTRARFDSLEPPYCQCYGDESGAGSALYRFALCTVAGIVLGVLVFPFVDARAGLASAILVAGACGFVGGYIGKTWGGVGVEFRIERARDD